MYGDNVHKAVKESSDSISGITIHYVNEKYDEGESIFQASCEIFPGDSYKDIAAKVLKLEHHYYPLILEALAVR